MDPITLSALVLGGTGLVGSLMQGQSNKSIAKANLQAQRETNLFNERNILRTNAANQAIAHEANVFNRENLQMQNDWNLEQWYRENLYNDPSSQVSRLIAAGINPYNAGLDGSGNAVGGLQSAAAAPAEVAQQEAFQAKAPQMDYTNTMFNDFLQGIIATTQSMSTNFDTQERRLTLGKRIDKLGEEINTLRSQKHLNEGQKDMLKELESQYKLSNMFASETFQKRVETVGLQNAVLSAQRDELSKRAALNEANEAYMRIKPELESMDLGIKQQQVSAYIQDSLRSFEVGMADIAQRTAQMNLGESQFQREYNMQRNKMLFDWKMQANKLKLDAKQTKAMSKMLNEQAARYKWMRKESQMMFPLRAYGAYQDIMSNNQKMTGSLLKSLPLVGFFMRR